MILDYSNYLLESRYKAENIDKKYYVWQISGKYGIGKKKAIIEIVSVIDGVIKYKIFKRNPGGYRDFFTEDKSSDNWNIYKISLSYWKRNMISHLLYATDDKEDALSFYENFELIKKYNI
jgi:hypothetical protein